MRLLKVWIYKKSPERNRRRAARVKSRNLLRCLRSDDMSHEFLCNLLDLSETGLRFVSSHKIKPGSILKLLLNLNEEDAILALTGKVVWASKISLVHAYRVGLSFLSLPEEHRGLLHRFVRHHARR